MAWGKHAQNMVTGVDKVCLLFSSSSPPSPLVLVPMTIAKREKERRKLIFQKTNLVLSSAHPSPFAAMKGFFGNGHFNQANTWLEGKYGPKGGVDWASLGAQA